MGVGQPQGEGPSGSAGGLEGTRFHVLQQKADGQKLSHWTLLAPFFFFKFIYFWLCWVFIAARGLFLVTVSGGYSLLQCAGFSLQWLLSLQSMGSRRVGFSSCGPRDQ